MNKLSLALACAVLTALLCSCTTAQWAALNAYGKKHHIRLYSGGQIVGEWQSTGKVESNERSDGYCFMDDKTGRLVDISGEVIIETEK